MRRYKAPDNIDALMCGGQFYAVKDGILEVQDGVDIDAFLRPLGFTDPEPGTTVEAASGTDSPA